MNFYQRPRFWLMTGVAVVSLAKRIEELFIPGRRAPLVLDHSTPELQLLQRVRDEAHRFAITHHRSRRDRAMTTSRHWYQASHEVRQPR